MNCAKCGHNLFDAIGDTALKTTSGQVIVFRRNTDFVICPACMTLYSITSIRTEVSERDDSIDKVATTLPVFAQ